MTDEMSSKGLLGPSDDMLCKILRAKYKLFNQDL